MEALLAFYLGWTMGARSGVKGIEEINTALLSLRESEEFAALMVALRKHAGFIIHEIATRVEAAAGDSDRPGAGDLLARVYELIDLSGQARPGKAKP